MTNRFYVWAFLIITGLAIFFRFAFLKEMPGGLFPDEAANGLDINLMAQGQIQPFYERGNGRESLFFYMLWASIALLGRGAWQHHIVSAGVGTLAVMATFLATRKLFLFLSQKDETSKRRAIIIALISAFLMAVSSWHVALSRTAFRANLIALFVPLVIWSLLGVFDARDRFRKYLYSFLSGAITAIGFYSYIAYRVIVPLLATALAWPVLASIKQSRWAGLREYAKPLFLFLAAFIIFIAPLAHYFHTHPGSFIGRSGQVSIFNPDLNNGDLAGTIIDVTKKSVTAYFTNGDLNWRHNISGAPFLSVLISPFFLLGMILVLIRAIQYALSPIKKQSLWPYFLLAGWFWSMLIPVVTTAEGIPHGLRSIGTIPVVFIITALGFYEAGSRVWQWLIIRHGKNPWRMVLIKRASIAIVTTTALALTAQTYILHFVYARNQPEYFYFYRADLTTVSDYLKQFGSKNNTYLVLDKFSVQTTDYLTTYDAAHPDDPRNQPYIQVDPEDSWKLQNLKFGDQIVFTQSSIFDIKKFKQYHPEVTLLQRKYNKFGEEIMAVYQQRLKN